VPLAHMIAKLIHAVKLHVALDINAPECWSLLLLQVAAEVTSTTESLGAAVGSVTNAGSVDAVEALALTPRAVPVPGR
jgi:hypothetical protein